MALKPCRECKKEVSQTAPKCPHCGADHPAAPPAARALGALVTLGLLGLGAWYFFGGGLEGKVAKDFIDQYEIAERSGDKMQMCVHAGLVSAAFIQAKDDANYQKWHSVESRDCAAAGVPR